MCLEALEALLVFQRNNAGMNTFLSSGSVQPSSFFFSAVTQISYIEVSCIANEHILHVPKHLGVKKPICAFEKQTV